MFIAKQLANLNTCCHIYFIQIFLIVAGKKLLHQITMRCMHTVTLFCT